MGVWDAGSRCLFDAVRYSTSWLLPVPILFGARALIALYIFISQIVLLALDTPQGARDSFRYFTVLSYWGLAFYYTFAALHTWTYWSSGRPMLARWHGALQVAHVALYTSVTTFPFIVTVIFWALIWKPNTLNTSYAVYQNTTQHALNLIFCIFEIVIPRTPPHAWMQLPVMVFLLLLYLCLDFMVEAIRGTNAYVFLDRHVNPPQIIAGAIIGVAVMMVVVFNLVRWIILGRFKLTEERWGKSGKMETKAEVKTRAQHIEIVDLDSSKSARVSHSEA